MSNKYVYISPEEEGFTKIKINKKKYKKEFPYIGSYVSSNIFRKLDCWVNYEKREVIIEEYLNILGQLTILILSPVLIFLYGIIETWESVSSCFLQKEKGHFSSIRSMGEEDFQKIMKTVKRNKKREEFQSG